MQRYQCSVHSGECAIANDESPHFLEKQKVIEEGGMGSIRIAGGPEYEAAANNAYR